jgi:peptidoglycan hydrolase CwlO-like protein
MKRCISSSRRISIAVIATGFIAISGSVFAQTVDDVLQAEDRRLNLAQQSQERINQIVEGTRSLEDQYARKLSLRTSHCPWTRSTSSIARSSP